MAERSVTFSIAANFAKARKEARQTKDEFEDLRREVDEVNKTSDENTAALKQNTAATKANAKAQSEQTKSRKGLAGIIDAAAGAMRRNNTALRQNSQQVKENAAAQDALARAQERASRASMSQKAAALALTAAQNRLAAVEKKHTQNSQQYADALLRVQRRQLDVESASTRHSRAMNAVNDATARAARAAEAGAGRFDRLGTSLRNFAGGATRVPAAMKGVAGGLGAMAIKIPVVLTGVGYLITALSNLAAGAMSLIGPLSSMVGVLATMPQAFSVAAGAVATFMGAFSGIGEALKQGVAVQQQAGQAAKDHARAEKDAARAIADAQRGVKEARQAAADTAVANARAIEAAQRGVIDAEDALLDATLAVRDARREATQDIKDQERALRDLEFAQRDASIGVEEAKQRLQEVLADPGATDLERRQAQLAYDEAIARLSDVKKEHKQAQKDFKEAQKKGVEGSDKVIAAKEAEADANRALKDAEQNLADTRRQAARAAADAAQAIKDAQQAVADAHDNAAESMEQASAAAVAYQQALNNLSPAGRRFVALLLGMRDELQRLKFAAQEGLLPGLGKALTTMLKLVPLAERGLFRFGQVIGQVAQNAANLLTSDEFMPMWSRLLESNIKLLRIGGRAFVNLLGAIVYLMDSARPLTEWLARTVEGWTALWRAQAKAGNESGKTAAFFEKTKRVLKILGGTIKNLYNTFKNIAGAGNDLGMDLLRSFRSITKGWADWTGSIKGQNQLKEWFDAARGPLHEMSVILGMITREIFDFGRENSDSFTKVLKTIEPLIPKLGDLMSNLQGDFGVALIEALGTLIDIFIRLTDASEGGLTSFVQTVGQVLKAIQWLLQFDAVNEVLSSTLTILGVFAALKFTGVLAAGKGIFKVFGGLFKFFKKGDNGVSKFSKSFDRIKKIFAGAIRFISKFGKVLGSVLVKAGGYILKFAGVVGRAMLMVGRAMMANPWMLLVAALIVVAYLVYKHWDKIKAFVVKAVSAIGKWIKKNWGIIKWFLGPLGLLIDLVVKHWDKIKKTFVRAVHAIIDFVKKHWDIIQWFVAPVLAIIKLVIKHWDTIKKTFVRAVHAIVDFVKKVWGGIKDYVVQPLKDAWNALKPVWNFIKDGFSTLWERVKRGAERFKNAIGSIWERITDVFSNPIEFLVNTVLNDWLIGNVNKILSALHLPNIPEVHVSNRRSTPLSDNGYQGKNPEYLARGGTVPGAGNRDSVPAMLMPGEFVVRKDAVRRIGVSRLHAMNEGRTYRGEKVRKYGFGGFVKGIGRKVRKYGGAAASHAADALFTGVRAGLHKVPGKGMMHDLPVGAANYVMDSLSGFIRSAGGDVKASGGSWARGGLIPADDRKRKRRPGVEGILGDATVQQFHRGGPVLGMKRGAKGVWVKALEELTHSKMDGTWDPLLNRRLKAYNFNRPPRHFDPPQKKDNNFFRWIKAADPEKVKHDKRYKTEKGDIVGAILREFYGKNGAHRMFNKFLAANGFITRTKHVTPGTPGTPGTSGSGGNIARAQRFAAAQVGKPYIWGGVGPRGYDCSGMQSAVVNVMKGNNPYHRLFATGSMASAIPRLGFKRGGGGPNDYTVGWYTGSPGHTSGRVGNYGIESTGSAVRHVGATSPSSFPNVWHLPGSGRRGGSAGTPGTPPKVSYSTQKKYDFNDHIKGGMKLTIPDVPVWEGARTWKQAKKRFNVGDQNLQQWFGDILPMLRKKKVSPHNYQPMLDRFNQNKALDKTIWGALNKRMGMPASKSLTSDTMAALNHAMAHAFGRKHDDFSFRPWKFWTPLEAEIMNQQATAEKTKKWQDSIQVLSGWGLTDLVEYLFEKGMDDGLKLAVEASHKRRYAERLNEELKQNKDVNTEDFQQEMKLLSYLMSAATPPGLRDASRMLGVSDYTTVKLWEEGNKRDRYKKVPAAKRAKLDADVASYRAGSYYFATGGSVPGAGNRDTVPAMLTPGEFVIKKSAAKALGLENLMALNNIQKFAKGGQVMSPTISSIPTKATVAGVRSVPSNSAPVQQVTNNYDYDIDINNPLPEKSTYSMAKMLQRQSALKGSKN